MTNSSFDFALPDNWECTALGRVSDLINGDRGKNYPGRKALAKHGIPFVNAGDLQDGQISTERLGFVPPAAFDLLRSGKFGLGDILYCIRGSLGKVAFNTKLPLGGIASSLIIVRPNPLISSKYVYYYLASPLAHHMIQQFDNGTAQPNLSGADLAKFQMPLPGFRTQEKVVAKIEELFSELDKGVESLTAAQAQLEVYRKAALKHAFEGKLTADWRAQNPDKIAAPALLSRVQADDAALPALPEGWGYAKLGALIEEPAYGTSKRCDYETAGIGVLRIPNVVAGAVDASDLKFAIFDADERETYRLRVGDILTIRSNGSVSLVGRCALVSEAEEQYLYAGYLIRLRPIPEAVHPRYLLNALTTHLLRSQIEGKAKSTSGVNNINSGELKSLTVPVCGKHEQMQLISRLERVLSSIDATYAEITAQLGRAQTLRQSILRKAFSGQLVAQDPSDEPASVLLERINAQQESNSNGRKKKNAKKEAA